MRIGLANHAAARGRTWIALGFALAVAGDPVDAALDAHIYSSKEASTGGAGLGGGGCGCN
jgi:hypothetical protein